MRQTSWRTVAFVVGIPIAYLVIWTILLILARAFGFSISDAGTLLSVLGSIMGAIFAVGGFLGLRVSNAVIEHFTYQLLMDTQVQPERLGTSVIPMFYAEFALMNPTPPKLEAIHWLEKALQHQDDPAGEVTAALALMYGYSDAYDLMLDTIQKARTLSLALISYFQRPVHLMMLIYACHSLASVEEAMRNVSLQLPKFDEVQRALREASNPKNNSSNIIQLYIEWFGLELK